MLTLFAGVALIKDTQQGLQFVAMFFPQPLHLDNIAVMGEAFYELFLPGQLLLGGMVVIGSFDVDNRAVIMFKVVSENINTDNG